MQWSQNPLHVYETDIEQVRESAVRLRIQHRCRDAHAAWPWLAIIRAGQDVTFRLTLRDGAGNRLHPQGSIPSYNDVIFGPNEAGIQYYRALLRPHVGLLAPQAP